MESQPQNPEFRNNPENFHPCDQLSSGTRNDCFGLSLYQSHFYFVWASSKKLRLW